MNTYTLPHRISVPQLMMLLFLSRMFSVLNISPVFGTLQSGATLLLGTSLSFLLQCVFLLPLWMLSRSYPTKTPIGCAGDIGGEWLKKGVAFLFLLMFFIQICGSLSAFSFFMTAIVFTNASSVLILIPFFLAILLCVRWGIEGCSRAAAIFFWIFLISAISICICAIPSANLLNISPLPAQDGFRNVLSVAFGEISKNGELYCLLLLYPSLRTPQKAAKSGFCFLLLTFMFMIITQTILLSVLSDFGMKQTYPYYALASVVDLSVLQRLDSFHMSLWIVCAFFRSLLYFFLFKQCIGTLLTKQKAQTILFSCLTVLLFIGSVFLSNHPQAVRMLNTSTAIVPTLLVLILPTVLLILMKRKEKRNETSSPHHSHRSVMDANC